MFRSQSFLLMAGVSSLTAALLTGCANEQAPPPAAGNGGGSQADTAQLDPEVEEALASLPQDDREAALEQKICPVSGEPLGSMGTPQKITVEGREVFICCEGCDEMLRENPEKYLAKLPAE